MVIKTKEEAKALKDSSRPIYYKSFEAKELQVDEESRRISGYAAIWGNKDDAWDILIKGCCAKSLQERGPGSTSNRKILLLYMHKTDKPIGIPVTLKEDDKGLYFEADVDKITLGDEVITQLKSGTLNQFSIGFMYVWDKIEWDEVKEAYIIKEINLFEISVVTFGCNELTEFTGMKSNELESAKNQLLRDTDRILKNFPYEEQLQIRQLIAKHISLAEAEPLEALKEQVKPKKEVKGLNFKPLENIQ